MLQRIAAISAVPQPNSTSTTRVPSFLINSNCPKPASNQYQLPVNGNSGIKPLLTTREPVTKLCRANPHLYNLIKSTPCATLPDIRAAEAEVVAVADRRHLPSSSQQLKPDKYMQPRRCTTNSQRHPPPTSALNNNAFTNNQAIVSVDTPGLWECNQKKTVSLSWLRAQQAVRREEEEREALAKTNRERQFNLNNASRQYAAFQSTFSQPANGYRQPQTHRVASTCSSNAANKGAHISAAFQSMRPSQLNAPAASYYLKNSNDFNNNNNCNQQINFETSFKSQAAQTQPRPIASKETARKKANVESRFGQQQQPTNQSNFKYFPTNTTPSGRSFIQGAPSRQCANTNWSQNRSFAFNSSLSTQYSNIPTNNQQSSATSPIYRPQPTGRSSHVPPTTTKPSTSCLTYSPSQYQQNRFLSTSSQPNYPTYNSPTSNCYYQQPKLQAETTRFTTAGNLKRALRNWTPYTCQPAQRVSQANAKRTFSSSATALTVPHPLSATINRSDISPPQLNCSTQPNSNQSRQQVGPTTSAPANQPEPRQSVASSSTSQQPNPITTQSTGQSATSTSVTQQNTPPPITTTAAEPRSPNREPTRELTSLDILLLAAESRFNNTPLVIPESQVPAPAPESTSPLNLVTHNREVLQIDTSSKQSSEKMDSTSTASTGPAASSAARYQFGFKCRGCHHFTISLIEIASHCNAEEPLAVFETAYQCARCSLVFLEKTTLLEHLWTAHSEGERFQCQYCQYTCWLLEDLVAHHNGCLANPDVGGV